MEFGTKLKKMLSIEFDSQPVYDEKYIKTKVKTFIDVINTSFSNNEIPKERNHYTCIAAICIDSVMKLDKKLSSTLHRTMQIQNKEEKGERLY